MRYLVVVSALIAAGCDRLFALSELPEPMVDARGDDARGDDAKPSDALGADAAVCNPNPNAHNEDGDALVDDCDPCPHIAGTAADADGDGVGDACDPQPTQKAQRIKFFDGFDTVKSEWSLSQGVTRTGETLLIPASTSPLGGDLAVPTGELHIVLGGSIHQLGTTYPRQLSIFFDNPTNGQHYVEVIEQTANDGTLSIVQQAGATYSALATQALNRSIPTGEWSFHIDESVTTQTIAFAAKLGGLTYSPMEAGPLKAAPYIESRANISIASRNLGLQIAYIVVIETQ